MTSPPSKKCQCFTFRTIPVRIISYSIYENFGLAVQTKISVLKFSKFKIITFALMSVPSASLCVLVTKQLQNSSRYRFKI